MTEQVTTRDYNDRNIPDLLDVYDSYSCDGFSSKSSCDGFSSKFNGLKQND